MPNAGSTPVVDSSTTTGQPVPLLYGFVWGTGKRLAYYMIQNTGDSLIDYTRVGIWALGEGELDGNQELWINDQFTWNSEWADTSQFHFHRGTDAAIGSGLNPSSSGPDQGVEKFFSWFPSGVQPLAYSRTAYYAIFRKQPVLNQTNGRSYDPTQWTDVAPIGLWRGLRVRLFDDQGNMTGYAFSVNPIWQFVDVTLRRRIYPYYGIDLNAGIDDLTQAARNRFEWGKLFTAAQYCDQLVTDKAGHQRRRFSGNFAFTSPSTLTAIQEQILRVCRGYVQEYAGKISVNVDMPRSSVFTFSRQHVMAGTLAPTDQIASNAGNSFVGKFRDLLVPACCTVASITCADHHNPVLTTNEPNPLNAGDRIAIGATGTLYDSAWTILSVPAPDANGNVYQATLVSKGSNYPPSVGAGGYVGLLYSRFKERAPTWNHKQNQLARGMVGLGLPRQLNPIPTEIDYSTCTFDQVMRLTEYERDRSLGFDVAPYVTPRALNLTIPLFSADAAGTGVAAIQIQDGDRVTLDDRASFSYQGDYEVLSRTVKPYNPVATPNGNHVELSADAQGGVLDLVLGPYDEGWYYDESDPSAASWMNVPDSDPGNDSNYTAIALVDGGKLAFLSGSVMSGSTFNLPTSGFNPSNMLAWCSPEGYIEGSAPMQIISLCDVNASRLCSLIYFDSGSGTIWHGALNVAAATWIGNSTAAQTVTVGPFTFVVFTLAGGETMCFGKGIVAHGSAVQLPAGFSLAQSFCAAFPHDGVPNGSNDAHWVGSYVDSGGIVNLSYKDGEGHVWHGNSQVLIFGWKNNSGQVKLNTVSGVPWMTYLNSDGFTLGVGFGSNLANGSTFPLPTVAGNATSLQVIPGSHAWDYPDNGHHAHGIGACYLDVNNNVYMTFEDGEGNVWDGTADVFALFYESSASAATGGISVVVSPAAMSIAPSSTLQFSAQVFGTSNTAVTWSVDGVAGGNATVGTIDATGIYTAPATNGVHWITATSSANAAAVGSQSVSVGTVGRGTGSSVSIIVTPGQSDVAAYGSVQLTATITGGSGSVVWAVNGVTGGNASVGTVTTGGMYTGPAQGIFGVTAALASDPSVRGGAIVRVAIPSGQYGAGGTQYYRP